MRNLILKDLILNKKFLIGIGLFYVPYMAYFGSRINNPRLAIAIGAFLTALAPLMTITREEKFKAAQLSCSLPATRKQIVQARYVLGWLTMTGLYALIAPAMVLFPGSKLSWMSVAGGKAVLTALAFLTLFFGALMPLMIRFGLVGMFSFLIGMQLLGIILMVLRTQGISLINIKGFIAGIRNALLSLNESLGAPGYFVALLAVLILVNLASLTLSVALFRRKDL